MKNIMNKITKNKNENYLNISSTNTKNKNFAFVFLYAIGSIFIVAGHCNYGGINIAFDLFPIFAFHIGLFIFCSGYFYKNKNENELRKYTWKKFKRLIIPMFIWNIIYGLFVQLTRLKGFTIGADFTLYNIFIEPLKNGHQFVYNMCFWFIPELFLIEIITCSVRKIISKFVTINEYVFFICYFLLGVLGIYLSNIGLNKGWNLLIMRTLYFFPFFGLGILYNRKLEKIDNLNNITYFSIVIALQLMVIFCEGKAPTFTPSWCKYFTSNLALPYIAGFLGIAFWLRISKILEPIIKNSKTINCIADNAYSIMAHQFFGFFVLKSIYAVLSKITPLIASFDFVKFKSNIWYYYIPNKSSAFYILYLIFGLIIPILINKIIIKSKKLLLDKFNIKNKFLKNNRKTSQA